ncbi:hypothetical protein IG631_04036 [Alternaria alternata]|nr:hypothetical protein IG631_04036 [Alternaria alternata]
MTLVLRLRYGTRHNYACAQTISTARRMVGEREAWRDRRARHFSSFTPLANGCYPTPLSSFPAPDDQFCCFIACVSSDDVVIQGKRWLTGSDMLSEISRGPTTTLLRHACMSLLTSAEHDRR